LVVRIDGIGGFVGADVWMDVRVDLWVWMRVDVCGVDGGAFKDSMQGREAAKNNNTPLLALL
jgi:hypothetical protein